MKSVSTPADDERRRPDAVEVEPRLAQHRHAEVLVDDQRDDAHHGEHRADVQRDRERRSRARTSRRCARPASAWSLAPASAAPAPSSTGATISPAPWALDIRNDHHVSSRAVDAHRRPARVRARLDEAEDAERDQREPGAEVQRRGVGDHPEAEHERRDDARSPARGRARSAAARAARRARSRSCMPSATANSQPIAGLSPW